jgi:CheY-like chemotaxis protein
MLTPEQQPISICLFELPEKDQAVIQRVVSFAASQGKPYTLHAEIQHAHIIITLDNIQLPPNDALLIRIGEEETLHCDIKISHPLLVTRVMRVLDDAAQKLKSHPTPTLSPPSLREPEPEPEIEKQPETTTPIAIEADTPNADRQGYLALVVDDSAAIRKQLELELLAANIRVEFAETGEEALEKSNERHYDLIFLDIIMPGIDGYEVCRQMRARKNMKKTPIIMLSGKTSPLDEVQGVIAGASTYLTKPVKPEQFQQTLKRVSMWLANFAR